MVQYSRAETRRRAGSEYMVGNPYFAITSCLPVIRPEDGRASSWCMDLPRTGSLGNQRDFICPIRAFNRALAGSLTGAKSEAFEDPGIVAEIVAQDGEVLAVGRGNAPNFAEETWLTQKSRGVTA